MDARTHLGKEESAAGMGGEDYAKAKEKGIIQQSKETLKFLLPFMCCSHGTKIRYGGANQAVGMEHKDYADTKDLQNKIRQGGGVCRRYGAKHKHAARKDV
mmetsp:Transcript_20468/g.31200  ORF Transcript_20468/g.31200 Transcript_20468/m.31200 type:complete len:101 (-) Transcript_20468:221-523(-)|eukprot:10461344-Prorocentrum_lima.AAC.1